jgi:hypothetical protein
MTSMSAVTTNGTSTPITKKAILLANKNISIAKYIDSIKKKHEVDKDYAKWNLNVNIYFVILLFIYFLLN